jgi:signal transduction histidine kinase
MLQTMNPVTPAGVEAPQAPARLATPVDYAALRPLIQSVRAALAGMLLVASMVGIASDVDWSHARAIAYGIVLCDAVVRIRWTSTALGFLIVDALAFGMVVGLGGHVEGPAIALVAYLVAAGTLLVPRRRVVWLLVAACAAFALRVQTLGLEGTVLRDPGGSLRLFEWAEAAALLLGCSLLLLSGASLVRAAQRRHEVALQAEQRASEMKNQFVSMISHELRTPLTNITGFAASLQETWQALDPPEVDEFLGIICREAEHLKNLVDDVLAIPRLEAGRLLLDPVDFPLRPAAYRIAELLFPEGGDTSATVAIPGNVVVRADPNRVEQVLRNLLDNARKYGGDHVGIEAIRRGDRYLVVVADNGPGVPADRRERIFDRFEHGTDSTEPTGTGIGLGLTVTRHLVEAMGGDVWYEPGFPVGARFCFTLPAGSGQQAARESSVDAAVAVGS